MICNLPCFLWRLSRQEILFVQLWGTQKDLNVFVIEVHEHLWRSKKQDKSVIVIIGKRNWKSREEKNKHWLVNIWISNLNIQHAKYKGDWKEHYCYFWVTLSCSLSQIKGDWEQMNRWLIIAIGTRPITAQISVIDYLIQ